jgi:hypothetical protein
MVKKILAGFILLFGVLGFINIYRDAPVKVAAEQADAVDPIKIALGECKEWTRQNSRYAVDNFVTEYEITGARLPKNHFKVGATYRTQGVGLLMATSCEATNISGHVTLIKGETGLAR